MEVATATIMIQKGHFANFLFDAVVALGSNYDRISIAAVAVYLILNVALA